MALVASFHTTWPFKLLVVGQISPDAFNEEAVAGDVEFVDGLIDSDGQVGREA